MATVGMDIGHSESTWEEKHSKGIITSLHPSGRFEEHWFNAEVSVFAKEILERNGVKVVMAQKPNDNNEVSLPARTRFYDSQNCDLIVSNHANAGVKSADGFCVFYWHNSAEAKRLAQIILKHSKSLPIEQFGTGVIASVPNTWTDFHMCREPKAISPLIEWGFFTNDHDLKLILSLEFRKQCAEVLAKAILEYLNIPYKPLVKPAPKPVEVKPEPIKEIPKEEEEMLERAIVIGGFADFPMAERLAQKLKAPIYIRTGLPKVKLAKEVFVVGGDEQGLIADKFINLSGKDRFETADKVAAFISK